MTKQKQLQYLIREFREKTGKVDFDIHEVVGFAKSKGWPVPPPISGEERLAKDFSQAAREETRQDSKSGKPYRVYHAFPQDGKGQGVLWFDIDDERAPRKFMEKSAVMRREQMVGDAVQLTLDIDHWNRVHPSDAPIDVPLDLGPDVAWRLAGPDESAA